MILLIYTLHARLNLKLTSTNSLLEFYYFQIGAMVRNRIKKTEIGSFSEEDMCETFKGYPKAEARKSNKHDRARGKSMVATNTPEKNELLEKELKRNKRRKILPKKPKRSPFDNKTNSDSGSESDVSIILQDSDCSEDYEDEILNITSDDFQATTDPKKGAYVLVEFEIKGKSNVFFVGLVEKVYNSGDLEVSFLRKSQKFKDKFVVPQVQDVSIVAGDQVSETDFTQT
jgi:hypothetical protein